MIDHGNNLVCFLFVFTLFFGISGAQAWGESLWSWQLLRDVTDRLVGKFTLMPLHLR